MKVMVQMHGSRCLGASTFEICNGEDLQVIIRTAPRQEAQGFPRPLLSKQLTQLVDLRECVGAVIIIEACGSGALALNGHGTLR